MRSVLKKYAWIPAGLILLLLVGFIIWASATPPPLPIVEETLQSDSKVTVANNRWIVFSPVNEDPTRGLIFYPGGRVDPEAYAPLARRLAEHGYLVVIVPMPLNLAVFDQRAADKVISEFPEIQSWAIAGHSLGGAMAASYVASRPAEVKALGLLASYPPSSADLSDVPILVSSIYATNDGLATLEDINASRILLPESTGWTEIEGGNHSQFGALEELPGDHPADISFEEQLNQTTAALLSLLQSIK